MKVFLKYISILLGFILITMVVLDIVYTTVYNTGAYRNKLMWVRDMDNITLDYVLLGSSRVNYSIKPNLIEVKTGKKGYNLGMNATNIVETIALFEEFLKYNTTKVVYVQVDVQYINEMPDPIGEVAWIPYIHEEAVYKYFSQYSNSYTYYRYVPFYRYQKFAGRLGFREVVSSATGSGYEYPDSMGYMPLKGMLQQDEEFVPESTITEENKLYTKFIQLCKKNDISVYFFTSPYYRLRDDLKELHLVLPNYTNFADSLQQQSYFSDPVHLNNEGAEHFTEIFIETYFSEAH
ncbi:hypothetical protein [Rasiella sp. SM2506]|uniref:hypothetical protein n=1 Tax=Rasiella sp. SM2506 TaxID=3423914 RepID=UPI003D7AA6C4